MSKVKDVFYLFFSKSHQPPVQRHRLADFLISIFVFLTLVTKGTKEIGKDQNCRDATKRLVSGSNKRDGSCNKIILDNCIGKQKGIGRLHNTVLAVVGSSSFLGRF